MTTTDHVLIIILSSLLSVFFLLCIAAIVIVIKLLSSVKQVVAKAENAVESVEEAAEVFKKAQGPMTLFKLIKNIVNLSQKGRK